MHTTVIFFPGISQKIEKTGACRFLGGKGSSMTSMKKNFPPPIPGAFGSWASSSSNALGSRVVSVYGVTGRKFWLEGRSPSAAVLDTLSCVPEQAHELYERIVSPTDDRNERDRKWEHAVVETVNKVCCLGSRVRFVNPAPPPEPEPESDYACSGTWRTPNRDDLRDERCWMVLGAKKAKAKRDTEAKRSHATQVDAVRARLLGGRTDEQLVADLAKSLVDPDPVPAKDVQPPAKQSYSAPVAPWANATASREPEVPVLEVELSRKDQAPMVKESRLHSGCHEVRLANNGGKWLVHTATGKAVLLKQSPEKRDFRDLCSSDQRWLREFFDQKKVRDLAVHEVEASSGMCAAGALGLGAGASCACAKIAEMRSTVPALHCKVEEHPLSAAVVKTACTHLGISYCPSAPASTTVEMKPMSRWRLREVRHANRCCQQSPDEIWTGKLHLLTRVVRKNTPWLSGWVDGLTNEGFQRVQQAFLKDAVHGDGPCRLRAFVFLAQTLVQKRTSTGVQLQDSEDACIREILAQWACGRSCNRLQKDGFRREKRCPGDCNDRQCCMAHLEALVTDDNKPKVATFGFAVDGTRRLYCEPLQALFDGKVPPVASISTRSLDLRLSLPEHRLLVSEVHPALQGGAAPAARPEQVRRPEVELKLEMSAEERRRIAAAYDEDAVRDEMVRKILNHPQVGGLKAKVLRGKKDESTDPDAFFREYVEDRDESWFDVTLWKLDQLQEQERERAKQEDQNRLFREQRQAAFAAERERAKAARAERSG